MEALLFPAENNNHYCACIYESVLCMCYVYNSKLEYHEICGLFLYDIRHFINPAIMCNTSRFGL